MIATIGRTPNLLSIAGSDPSGGAGLQADLKTFAALGCHGMAAPTALTAQNTLGVTAVHLPPPDFVAEQIAAVLADIEVAAIKIGMLGSAEIVDAVAAALAGFRGPVVLDPVLVATSGATLGDDTVIAAMRARLFASVTLVTPNLAEAARLLGVETLGDGEDAVSDAARRLRGSGTAAWLIKGGHGTGDMATDVLLDEQGFARFSSPRVATRNTHGTGCTLSSAIAAALARGEPLRAAVASAKRYLDAALAGADRLTVGAGPGPVDHFARWRAP